MIYAATFYIEVENVDEVNDFISTVDWPSLIDYDVKRINMENGKNDNRNRSGIECDSGGLG